MIKLTSTQADVKVEVELGKSKSERYFSHLIEKQT